MSHLAHSLFTTEALPQKERFAAWQDGISSIFDVRQSEPENECPFYAQFSLYRTEHMALGELRSSAARYTRNKQKIHGDGLDMILVQLFIAGEVQFGSRTKTTYATTGDIVIFDLAQTNDNFNSEFRHLTAGIARDRVEAVIPDIASYHGTVLPRTDPAVALLRNHLLASYELAPKVHSSASIGIESATLALLLGALKQKPPIDEPTLAVNSSLAYQIRRHIRRNLADPKLSPDTIAKSLGLSRSHLYRLMQPLGGITGFITELRLDLAKEKLENPKLQRLTIAEVAYQSGFQQLRTFNRLFRERFGGPPSEIKSAAAQGFRMQQGLNDERFGYEAWFREFST